MLSNFDTAESMEMEAADLVFVNLRLTWGVCTKAYHRDESFILASVTVTSATLICKSAQLVRLSISSSYKHGIF